MSSNVSLAGHWLEYDVYVDRAITADRWPAREGIVEVGAMFDAFNRMNETASTTTLSCVCVSPIYMRPLPSFGHINEPLRQGSDTTTSTDPFTVNSDPYIRMHFCNIVNKPGIPLNDGSKPLTYQIGAKL